ncbi:hypothetical protein A3G67_01260 [Candidatus Roizmanbacteria bacterium RIFCSPLOWO2_12_FULL_40_12]|uniref:Glycerophosphoryl diester phosphodiesterase membrane domain-containing protein n=1 Tax=Candidatus Roizmanbacteria bacterium RIFCSPLOWO2_01_FULL_40_42 TaxID=1802066 RepID=A0A1F7J527_9BACT|nr:MAG: hypothetical protein A2779_01735 [Candidatus Roizmanbacteria bacterium RIFCSPHIGHO2_01_FULL_40_98]OGK28533.1 MAG: hypothetical protein A3C31_01055 [Candidatus Roizmanbacteria bacterium RIFCSPHIGHO2_02_FULL_40_53]OGK30403.1 MAG: hypothetical protein A2W49_00790 [Candidatus Roizmanbacteria bacterium RIFCSPHIGHO2_12_41_18]OGK36566.1 MAG: hypothetical protein A3E69_03505 [Candidatus Roizmanbacteria bacterium RIFCSPHIGHO2_12_FULL_40_130]OGK50721.1 MAG: hypothetical protein A3B50_04445 [Candi
MHGDVLFKKALERVKDRFFNFLIVTVLGWGLGLAIVVGFLVSVGIVLGVWAITKAPPVVGTVAMVMGILSISLLAYLSSWTQLATTDSLIQSKKLPPFETFKRVRPYVKSYIWFVFLLMFFLIGLLPFTVLSLFIVGILWSLWSSFSIFVFLEKKKKGLENLWISRDMVNQKFWPIAGLVFVVVVVVVLISALFATVKNGLVNPIISQLIVTPFVTSFYYEMYKTLKVPQNAKKPVVWIWLSVIGFVAVVVAVVLSFQVISTVIPELMKKSSPQNELYRELLYPSSPDETI